MWLDFYKEVSELLIKQTDWEVESPSRRWDIPKIIIRFNRNDEIKDLYFGKITYSIYFGYESKSENINKIIITKDDFYLKVQTVRKFYIDETLDVEVLVKKIIEEVPFKKAEDIPKHTWKRKKL
ncbi:hypothetical protein [Fischerella sp. PCC 9605]|uniref:hypothetical protein n=1 Tax=Fischerella sp. PCC 9605 TaxID=1173024 RepID=UPI00047E03FA|nr:hypothetical protein [Fischerella sp. PCC 9605]